MNIVCGVKCTEAAIATGRISFKPTCAITHRTDRLPL